MSEARDYRAEYEAALKCENEKMSYIDHMSVEDLRKEMRALIKMLEVERKFTSALQKRLREMTDLAFEACSL